MMIEVVFGESTKGSMKAAKKFRTRNITDGSICYIGEKPSKTKLERLFGGEALGGQSSDVIGICLDLDVGNIDKENFLENRKKMTCQMFKGPHLKSVDYEDECKKYCDDNTKEISKLVACAKNGEHIRIWYSNEPHSLCGYYYINLLLKGLPCEISAVKLPEYQIQKNGSVVSYISWGEIMPGKFSEFLSFEKTVSVIERNYLALKWYELRNTNAGLRALVNGQVTSVDDDFYDYFIRVNIPDNEFRMGKLIGDVMGKQRLGITDWWIAKRINNMIANNELIVLSEGDFEYDIRLRRK